jgi:hypothetical protein
MTEPKHAIYYPPRDGLPHLVVSFFSETKVTVIPTDTPQEARVVATILSKRQPARVVPDNGADPRSPGNLS